MVDARPRIAVITDDPGWHGRQLLAACEAQGASARYVRLQDCRLVLDDDRATPRHGLWLGPFGHALPDGVFVRGVPGGTLEQVILRLDVLHALQAVGVPVYNSARAIERTVDKAMTSFLLRQAGIPTPPTWVTEDASACRDRIAAEWAQGHEVICKPLFGSQGEGLLRLAPGMPLPDLQTLAGVAYLQRFVAPRSGTGMSRDFRVFVIGGRADCAMARYGTGWIHNVAQGARCETVAAQGDLAELALAATRALDMDYAGVDLIAGADGRLQVLEVNSVPAWYGLQGVTAHTIADRLAHDLLDRCVLPAMARHREPASLRLAAGGQRP